MQSPFGTDDTRFPPLSLPPELRNDVYRLALIKAGRISFERGNHRLDERAVPALLQVCRQMRDEALPIYFGENSFSFFIMPRSPHRLLQFLTTIVHQLLKQCTSVILLETGCRWCESSEDSHSFEVNFQLKTIKQHSNCRPYNLDLPQDAMRHLPQIIKECNLKNSNAIDLRSLGLQLVHALTDRRVLFRARD